MRVHGMIPVASHPLPTVTRLLGLLSWQVLLMMVRDLRVVRRRLVMVGVVLMRQLLAARVGFGMTMLAGW